MRALSIAASTRCVRFLVQRDGYDVLFAALEKFGHEHEAIEPRPVKRPADLRDERPKSIRADLPSAH